ncbi:hypothetical protein [Streptomyces sp. NPDC005435]
MAGDGRPGGTASGGEQRAVHRLGAVAEIMGMRRDVRAGRGDRPHDGD